jgi:transcriptional regulator with XRE-family HTH domain
MKGSGMTSIAENIKEKMLEKGISAHALEKEAGLKNSAVQNILYGRSKNPSIKILTAISQVLNCNLSQLIGDDLHKRENTNEEPQISANTKKDERPWHSDLYIASFNLVSSLLKQTNVLFTKKKLLDTVDEVYIYSYKQNSNEPDKYFASWLINKNK